MFVTARLPTRILSVFNVKQKHPSQTASASWFLTAALFLGGRKLFQENWNVAHGGNWEQRGRRLCLGLQTVPGPHVPAGWSEATNPNPKHWGEPEITGLYGFTRLRLAVGGAKQLCEGLWPDSNDSRTLRLIRYDKRNYIKVEIYISESGILNILYCEFDETVCSIQLACI